MKRFALIFTTFLMLFFYSCNSKVDYSDHGNMAFVTAQEEYVKPKMNYPDETKFDVMPNYIEYSKLDSVYSVGGKGTTKNGFGVVVPIVFKCKLKYLGGDDLDSSSWQLVGDIDIF